MKPTIAILGAGISGLLIAYKLKKQGFSVKVLEARNRLGGRVHTLKSTGETPIEMGATWFVPQHRNLIGLLEELSIDRFKQYMQGPIFYEADSSTPPQLMHVPTGAPSFRIAGGTKTVIDALSTDLSSEELALNSPVRSMDFSGKSAEVKTDNQVIVAEKVISTLPPSLLVSTIKFDSVLPEKLLAIASNTHTWMQDSIKVGISYDRPFWRDQRWSGTLFSNVGPITEFYDHSDSSDSRFALCGFVHEVYAQLTPADRLERIHKQLASVFGQEALNYLQFEEVVWSQETYTKDQQSTSSLIPHQNNGHEVFRTPLFDKRFYISGSETSPNYGGYMDGAVFAAEKTVAQILSDS